MEGFEKIDLPIEKEKKPNEVSMNKSQSNPHRRITLNKRVGIIVASVAVFCIVVYIFLVMPIIVIYADAKDSYQSAKEIVSSMKKQDVATASDKILVTQQKLQKIKHDYDALAYLQFIPLVNWYYGDGRHFIRAGFSSLEAGKILVDALKPYADVLGLKGSGSFVSGSAQDRITTAVRTMDKITPRIDDVANKLVLAKKEIDGVDINHYPGVFGGEKIRKNLTTVKTLADQGIAFIDQARPLIKVLPSMLGEPQPKKYFILFQNDKELRATGGFLTAYAVFRVEHGTIHIESSEDIYTLDDTISNKPKAPDAILTYLPKVYTFNLRDSNLSPDFFESMKVFQSLYQKSPSYNKIDGIIAIDTQALVAAMNVLGDITVNGTTFTTKTDARCNCPQVIYELEVYADQPVGHTRSNRKGLIGDLMYAIMDKAFSSSPKLYWGPLFQTMLAAMNQKHVIFDLYNAQAQQGIESLNAGGRIKTFSGDYLHINDSNFGGAKSNMYVKQSVKQDITVNSAGAITKTITINYKNSFPPSDCNLERGNLCLNADLRNRLRIYVPKGSQLVNAQGSELKVSSYEELGKTVFEGFFRVRPLGQSFFTITYTLPFKLENKSPLPLLIQKQPGTEAPEYIISVNGKTLTPFSLLTDKEITIRP